MSLRLSKRELSPPPTHTFLIVVLHIKKHKNILLYKVCCLQKETSPVQWSGKCLKVTWAERQQQQQQQISLHGHCWNPHGWSVDGVRPTDWSWTFIEPPDTVWRTESRLNKHVTFKNLNPVASLGFSWVTVRTCFWAQISFCTSVLVMLCLCPRY